MRSTCAKKENAEPRVGSLQVPYDLTEDQYNLWGSQREINKYCSVLKAGINKL